MTAPEPIRRPSSSPAARPASAARPRAAPGRQRAGRSTRPRARLESIADLEARGCTTLALDVTDEASMQAAVDAVEAEHGAVGVLVNNAGYSPVGRGRDGPMDDVRRQFETNVFGLVRLCQLVLPGMRAQRLGQDRERQLDGRRTSRSRAAASTTRPSTRSRRSATRCASRSRASASTSSSSSRAHPHRASATPRPRRSACARRRGPYAEFNAARRPRRPRSAYEKGPLSQARRRARDVAKAIERAITAQRPKIRYRVTPSARTCSIDQRALMTDGMWDRFLRDAVPAAGQGLRASNQVRVVVDVTGREGGRRSSRRVPRRPTRRAGIAGRCGVGSTRSARRGALGAETAR